VEQHNAPESTYPRYDIVISPVEPGNVCVRFSWWF